MRYRRLGRWGLEVSTVSLGSWLTFGGSVDDDATRRCVRRAFEVGVNFFDTANSYARGGAELALGKAIAGLPRERLVIGTKVFSPMGEGPNERGLSRKHVFEQCHASLRRLDVDYVDLYQCHRFDPSTPLEETCRVMDDLIRQGKILYWGVSEWTPQQMRDAVALCERDGLHPPVSDQPRYSLLQREIEDEVIPTCRRLGLGVIAFSPLARGALTGKYRSPDDRPAGSRGADPKTAHFLDPFLTPESLARVERVREAARDLGCTPGQLAIAWVLRRQEVTTALTGATRVEQVEENAAAADLEIDQQVFRRLEGNGA